MYFLPWPPYFFSGGGLKRGFLFLLLKSGKSCFSPFFLFFTRTWISGEKGPFPLSRFFRGGEWAIFFVPPPQKKLAKVLLFPLHVCTFVRQKNISNLKIFPSWVGHFHFLFWNLRAILPRPSASLSPFFPLPTHPIFAIFFVWGILNIGG